MQDANFLDRPPSNLCQARKRSYDQMAQEGSRSVTPSLSRPQPSASYPNFLRPRTLRRRLPTPPSAPPSGRYMGDGLDFRRPIMSTDDPAISAPVIDLTGDSDSPPPQRSTPTSVLPRPHSGGNVASRGGADVIDLSAAPPEADPFDTYDYDNHLAQGINSPEIQLLYSGRVPVPPPPATLPAMETDWGYPTTADVETPESRSRLWSRVSNLMYAPLDLFTGAPNQGGMSFPIDLFDRTARTHADHANEGRRHNHAFSELLRPPLYRPRGFQDPGLDYETISFQIGPEPPRREPYTAPSPARDGFTRSPQEEDIIICPNCDDELGVGEDELKQQVWVIKSCGHVYCGHCAQNRSKRSRKDRPDMIGKPFSKCVVEGCGKTKTSGPKALFQVYV